MSDNDVSAFFKEAFGRLQVTRIVSDNARTHLDPVKLHHRPNADISDNGLTSSTPQALSTGPYSQMTRTNFVQSVRWNAVYPKSRRVRLSYEEEEADQTKEQNTNKAPRKPMRRPSADPSGLIHSGTISRAA